ncbi:MAG: hypothetical protein H6717_25600 [Polyangiaceae bacterium]|nr:hypothetical protein [Polyangiaceae bacterium]
MTLPRGRGAREAALEAPAASAMVARAAAARRAAAAARAAAARAAGSGGALSDAGDASDGSLVNDFGIQILTSQVQIGLGGKHFLPVELTRGPGFTAAVDVTLSAPPSGLTAQPLTIVAGETFGELQLSAKSPLTVGSTFQLTITGSSGTLSHDASVNTFVTEKSGTLDKGFASNGIHLQSFGQHEVEIYDVHTAKDSRILFAGYQTGLSLAPMIGILATEGKKVDTQASIQPCSACSPEGYARGIATMPSGPVLFATERYDDFIISKHGSTNLGLDLTFGSSGPGYTRTDAGGTDKSLGVAALEAPTGTRLFVFGTSNGNSAVAQLNALGTVQKTVTNLGMQGATHSSLAVTPNGRVYMVGNVTDGGGKIDMKLVALDANLALDTGFNGTGSVTYGASGVDDKAVTVLPQEDDKVLVAGSTNKSLWVRRYLPDGQLDPTFGTNGMASVAVNANSVTAADAVRFPDDRLVLLGNAVGGNNPGPAAVRLRRNGQADPSWGDTGELGVVHLNLGQNAKIWAGDVQLSGTPALYRLVVGGTAENTAQFNVINGFVARAWY